MPVRLAPQQSTAIRFRVHTPRAGESFSYPVEVYVTDGRKLYVVQGTIVVTAAEGPTSDDVTSEARSGGQGGNDSEQPADAAAAGAEAKRR